MSEKLKIISCTLKKDGGSYKIYSCTSEGGRTGDTFKEVTPGEYDVEITPNGQYADKWKIVEPKKFGTPRDYTFEKKRSALEFAVNLASNGIIKTEQIDAAMDKFFNYLNQN